MTDPRELTEDECDGLDPEFVQEIFDIFGHLSFTLEIAHILDDNIEDLEDECGRVKFRDERQVTDAMTTDAILAAHREHTKRGTDIPPAKMIKLLEQWFPEEKEAQKYIKETHAELAASAENKTRAYTKNLISGADFINQVATIPHVIWGTGNQALWTTGESLMIASAYGVGKTTLAGLVVRALIFGGKVLGHPLQIPFDICGDKLKVLYLALDRPDQIARSMGRQFTATQLKQLDDRLTLWQGPLPGDVMLFLSCRR
jgi:hypothetical protein